MGQFWAYKINFTKHGIWIKSYVSSIEKANVKQEVEHQVNVQKI